MLGPAGDKTIQILLPLGLLPLPLFFCVTTTTLLLAAALPWLPALRSPSAWCEFLHVSGSIPPSVTAVGFRLSLAQLQLYTFQLVGACYPLPVFQSFLSSLACDA